MISFKWVRWAFEIRIIGWSKWLIYIENFEILSERLMWVEIEQCEKIGEFVKVLILQGVFGSLRYENGENDDF